MIGKVQRGKRINGLIRYLFGPGECNEHVNPHVVAGFRPAAALEPPLRPDGTRDVAGLNRLLNQPLALIPEERRYERPVRHIVLRAAPEDPILSDDDWAAIAHQVMNATGRAPYGDDLAVRWVAVRHAPDHIHLAFNLARQDGGRPPAWDDYRALREACRRIEQRYGLRATARSDGTAAKRPSRAEAERAERSGRSEPVRNTLRRAVQQAAAGARSEADFLARLRDDGVRVRLRNSIRDPGQVTGYAVALPEYTNKAGEPVWFSGGKLAADLTLPRLRHRWNCRPRPAARFDRAALRDTVRNAAAVSLSEAEFFGLLGEYGLRARPRYSQLNPGELTGYAVARPEMSDQAGAPIWIAGGRLDPALGLPRLRRRWNAGPAFEERDRVWMSEAAARAAAEVRFLAGRNPAAAGDAAWATADVLHVAARHLGNRYALRRAADAYGRAARELHGRGPRWTRSGAELRTAARILADSAGDVREQTRAILTLIEQLGGLADAVAGLRTVQRRPEQAAAAVRTAGLLRAGLADVADVQPGRGHHRSDALRMVAEEFPHDLHSVVSAERHPRPDDRTPSEPRLRGPRR